MLGSAQRVDERRQNVLERCQALLPVDDVVPFHPQQPRLLLGFEHDCAHEVRHGLAALQACFGFVADVLPKATPLIFAVPDVRSLVERNTVLSAVLVDLLNGKGS